MSFITWLQGLWAAIFPKPSTISQPGGDRRGNNPTGDVVNTTGVSGTLTPTNNQTGGTTVQEQNRNQCEALGGVYNAATNTCTIKKPTTPTTTSQQTPNNVINNTGVSGDGYLTMVNKLATAYQFNANNVQSLGYNASTDTFDVLFTDGSHKTFKNPNPFKTNPGTNSIAKEVVPAGSKAAAPVVVYDWMPSKKTLASYPDWTKIVLYSTGAGTADNSDCYAYAGGICNSYGKFYTGYEGDRDPVQAYIAAHPPANPNQTGSTTVVQGSGNVADGLHGGGPVVQTTNIEIGGGTQYLMSVAKAEGYGGSDSNAAMQYLLTKCPGKYTITFNGARIG